MKPIVIWQPKFSTREVLVSKVAIREGKNYLFFCCDRNHPDLYSFNEEEVKEKGHYVSNGKIICLAFSLDLLTNEGELSPEYKAIQEKEYNKFKKFTEKTSNKK